MDEFWEVKCFLFMNFVVEYNQTYMEESNQPKIVNTNLKKTNQPSKITLLEKGPILSQRHLNSLIEAFKPFSVLNHDIGYWQQFVLLSAKTVKSTFNLLRKKKAPPWTKSCGHKTKDQKI